MSQVQNGTQEMLPDKRTYTVEEVAHILGIGRPLAKDCFRFHKDAQGDNNLCQQPDPSRRS